MIEEGYLGESSEVDREQLGRGLLALVRGENNRLVLCKRDCDFTLVHHLQLRANSVEHNLSKKIPNRQAPQNIFHLANIRSTLSGMFGCVYAKLISSRVMANIQRWLGPHLLQLASWWS